MRDVQRRCGFKQLGASKLQLQLQLSDKRDMGVQKFKMLILRLLFSKWGIFSPNFCEKIFDKNITDKLRSNRKETVTFSCLSAMMPPAIFFSRDLDLRYVDLKTARRVRVTCRSL